MYDGKSAADSDEQKKPLARAEKVLKVKQSASEIKFMKSNALIPKALKYRDEILGGMEHESKGYVAVAAEEIEGWPNVSFLGDTQPPGLKGVSLKTVAADGKMHLVLEGGRDFKYFNSIGLAVGIYYSGEYRADKMERAVNPGPWDDQLNHVNTFWYPAKPESGKYEVHLHVTDLMAEGIRKNEQQHIDDHEYAYECSFLALQRVVGTVKEVKKSGDEGRLELLEILTNKLIRNDLTHLIPKSPDELDPWAARVHTVYADLCGLSKERDRRGWRTSKGGEANVKGAKIFLNLLSLQEYTSSESLINPSDVERVFGFNSFERYLESRDKGEPSFKKGDKVKVSEIAKLGSLSCDLYPAPGGKSIDTDRRVAETLKKTAGVFDSVKEGTRDAWISVRVAEGEWNYLGDVVYVLVAVEHLQGEGSTTE
ncbi:hypothetical protein [Streptomyces sp. NPDC006285]|uniref:hypothetical protein n=1 Tax=Streptomyces sp. NPDC006285 TaxID=3364742 RepID=UPI0036D10920